MGGALKGLGVGLPEFARACWCTGLGTVLFGANPPVGGTFGGGGSPCTPEGCALTGALPPMFAFV
jgi:hypothetical protein